MPLSSSVARRAGPTASEQGSVARRQGSARRSQSSVVPRDVRESVIVRDIGDSIVVQDSQEMGTFDPSGTFYASDRMELERPSMYAESGRYGEPAPIVVEEDGTIRVDEPGSPYQASIPRSQYDPTCGSCDDIDRTPASRISRSRVERIVSMAFPNAPARPVQECYQGPDERDDIMRELRLSISRLEKRVKVLEGERTGLQGNITKLNEDNALLRKEIARLNALLDEERALSQVNLSSEEMRRREAYDLVELQRKLLLLKDDEIRQLGQLAVAQKETIFILYSHLGSPEINSILDDAFDIRQVDLGTLDPDCRGRVTELLHAQALEGRLDLPVKRPRGKGKGGGSPLYVHDRSEAQAMDAADGVVDGQYEGRAIMVPKRQPGKSSGYGRTGKAVYARDRAAAQQLDAADGVVDGRYQGADILVPKGRPAPRGPSTGTVYARDRAAAANLDAADGVIDGRYGGQDILVPKGRGGNSGSSVGSPVYASGRREAQELDAADGVVDGRYQGHDILVPKGSGLKQQLSAARAERERVGGKYR